jgi:hypothetical protein
MTTDTSFEVAVSQLLGEAVAASSSGQIAALERRLHAPLSVAIVGRVNAGKSTLVNALLGRQVAPTDVSECTRIVTWFRYGSPERVEAVMKGGARKAVQLEPDGRLPRTLGVDSESVQSLQVVLSSDVLRSMTIVDTPGLASANVEISAVTEQLLAIELDSRSAAQAADTVVFVLNQNPRADELEALRSFRGRDGGIGASITTAVGVLTKADQLGDAETAWPSAVAISTRYAEQLQSELLTIVPLIGLLAETSESAALTETDAAHIGELARLDDGTRVSMLVSVDRFLNQESSVPIAARRRLLALLGLYGIEKVLQLSRGGITGAAALRRELSQLSGMAPLRQTLLDAFVAQGRLVRARATLLELVAACTTRHEDPAHDRLIELQSRAEALLIGPTPEALDLEGALSLARSPGVAIPPHLMDDLHELQRCYERIDRSDRYDHGGSVTEWREFLFSATPSEAAVAEVAIRSHSRLYARARDLEL